jgi:hypothetical protein
MPSHQHSPWTAHGQPVDRDLVPLAVAAAQLGVTTVSLRKRAQRGSLTATKIDGAWFVPRTALGAETVHARDNGQPTGRDTGQPGEQPMDAALVAALERHITQLTQLLEIEVEARRRADHIIAGLVERVRELPASDAQDAAQRPKNGPQRDDRPEMASDSLALVWRRWWRRVRGA